MICWIESVYPVDDLRMTNQIYLFIVMSQYTNSCRNSLWDFLDLRHPNHFVLAGARGPNTSEVPDSLLVAYPSPREEKPERGNDKEKKRNSI